MTVAKRIARSVSDLTKVREAVPNSRENYEMIDALLKAEKAGSTVYDLTPSIYRSNET